MRDGDSSSSARPNVNRWASPAGRRSSRLKEGHGHRCVWVALVVVLGLLLAAQLGAWIVLVQVVQQQGRILLRLDALAEQHAVVHDRAPVPIAPEAVRAPGIPVGSGIGDFDLSDLTGLHVTPDVWQGRRTLVISWSPSCGFCELIAPELAQIDSTIRGQSSQLVLVSSGTREANQRLAEEYGLTCQILLQSDDGLPAFRHLGTPVAYLLDVHARVSEPLAVGADAVLDQARRLAAESHRVARGLAGRRSLADSRIERNGLVAGTRAPTFSLPTLSGGMFDLERYQGQRVLLVFTDPHCGPCHLLLPDLARLAGEGSRRGLQVVAVGRGSPEENRPTMERYADRFPVALQQRWEVSRAYGIFTTPVAFLIGEDGLILRDVAIGPRAVVELADDGSTVEAGRG